MLQKKAIRIITGIRDRESHRKYFRELEILPLKSQYIYSLSLFVINNRHHFEVNSEIHNSNTRIKADLLHPSTHFSVFQEGIYHAGIKGFTGLPVAVTDPCHNTKQFKLELKNFYSHSFYTLDDYFKYKMNGTFYNAIYMVYCVRHSFHACICVSKISSY
jgi:hypothetical protein